jgi:hypothetical protein
MSEHMPKLRAWKFHTDFLVVHQWKWQEWNRFMFSQKIIPFLCTRAGPNVHVAIFEDNGENETMLERDTWQFSLIHNCTIGQ